MNLWFKNFILFIKMNKFCYFKYKFWFWCELEFQTWLKRIFSKKVNFGQYGQTLTFNLNFKSLKILILYFIMKIHLISRTLLFVSLKTDLNCKSYTVFNIVCILGYSAIFFILKLYKWHFYLIYFILICTFMLYKIYFGF